MSAGSFLLIFLGGGLGAACRYEVGRFIGERYTGSFPLGTSAINVTGCFALGLLASLVSPSGAAGVHLTALLETGFLGGYTTFSTYALEAVVLYTEGSRRIAVSSVLAPVVLGLTAAALGAGLGHIVG